MQTVCDQLNIDDVCINTAEINKGSHGFFIPIRSKNKQSIVIQTPKMFAPFGAGCYKKAEVIAAGKVPRYDVQLSLDASNVKIQKLGNYLMQIDNKVCRAVSQDESLLQLLNVKRTNKKTGKPKTLEEIQDDLENNKYTPLVRIKPDSKYPPLFKIAISRDTKTQSIATFFEIGNKSVELNDDNIDVIFHKCMPCKCVFIISHIWILSNRFGVSLKLKRCKIFPQDQNTYGFIPEDDEDGSNNNENNENENENENNGQNENEDNEHFFEDE